MSQIISQGAEADIDLNLYVVPDGSGDAMRAQAGTTRHRAARL
ncbi:hypothetical protein Z945_1888 [Sulfitobacter noctilucae]|nr:hypothetical protein Z945_1888 [Sulfitobacter noctilucae]